MTPPLSLGGAQECSADEQGCILGWADCLGMISERHPEVAQLMVDELEGAPRTSCLEAAASTRELTGVCDFDPPTWHVLAQGVRPASREPEDFEPGVTSSHEFGAGLALSTCPTSTLTKIPIVPGGPSSSTWSSSPLDCAFLPVWST